MVRPTSGLESPRSFRRSITLLRRIGSASAYLPSSFSGLLEQLDSIVLRAQKLSEPAPSAGGGRIATGVC